MHTAHGVGHAVGSGACRHVVRVQGTARAAAGSDGEILLALLDALFLVRAGDRVLEAGGVGGVAGDGDVNAFLVHDGNALTDIVSAVAADVCALALGVADLADDLQFAGVVVKLGLNVGEAVDAGDNLRRILAKAVQNDAQRGLSCLVGVADDTDRALGGCEGLVAREEAEALRLLRKEHRAQIAVAKADLAVIGDGAVDAERLQAFADGGSSLSSGLDALLHCDGRAYRVSPARIFKADGLNALDDLVRIKALGRTMISGFSFIGGQGPSYGSFIIKLKDWDERSMIQNSDVVVGSLYMRAQKIIKEAQVLFFAPPMIPGYSASTDIEVNMQDKTGGDLNKFFDVVNDYTAALEARPEINSAKTSFNPNFPQYMIDIDAAACKKAGISPSDILTTMQGYYGGLYASNFNRFGKMYRVMIQSDPLSRKNLESLKNIKVRNSAGEMAPIAQFISVEKVYGPDIISRFNLYTSMKVMVAPASGYTSGQALTALAEVAQENLPTGYTYELGGMAREEAQSSGSATGLIFVLCFVFVYLLLSAQYESYILPLAVLLSIPFGLLGSFLFVNGVSAIGNISALKMILGTMSNNIYMQIALIMLMGLLAKNAILIVEFALDRRKMGMSITWAAVLGAGARLRPILMTSLAMVVGLLPLMFAFGVGAHGNRTLGTASIGGMLIGMICQIFIVPALFVIFQYLQEKVKPMEWEDIDNADAVTEIEQYAK